MTQSTFQFNHLTQTKDSVSNQPLSGFQSDIAFLLGSCCSLTYSQFAIFPSTLDKNQSIAGGWKATLIGDPIYTTEAISLGATVGKSGYYRKIPAGFALHATSDKYPKGVNVIALRGTITYDEWVKDAEAIPTQFLIGDNNGHDFGGGLVYGYDTDAGSVHGGFFKVYTQGKDGTMPEAKETGIIPDYYKFPRVEDSIAAAIKSIINDPDFNHELPLYITGHSLGAALAVICAADIAMNFPNAYSEIAMYNLAGPSVAAGLSVYGHTIYGLSEKFVNYFEKHIPNSYRIVNAADIVPIAVPKALNLEAIKLDFAHVAPDRQITFCDQTGSIGGNHSCDDTYLPYLSWLASQ